MGKHLMPNERVQLQLIGNYLIEVMMLMIMWSIVSSRKRRFRRSGWIFWRVRRWKGRALSSMQDIVMFACVYSSLTKGMLIVILRDMLWNADAALWWWILGGNKRLWSQLSFIIWSRMRIVLLHSGWYLEKKNFLLI